ncbi:MAG: hypothetical protein ACYTFV_11735 [Planctomycetota bacterium]|jgi:hypothetical protein
MSTGAETDQGHGLLEPVENGLGVDLVGHAQLEAQTAVEEL